MLKAQDSLAVLKSNQFSINAKLYGILVNHEAKLSQKLSFVSGAGIAFGGSSYMGRYSISDAFKVINPELNAELRYYYNFSQRLEKKKKTGNNAANFFSFKLIRGFMPFTSAELTTTSEYYINGVRQPDIQVAIEPYASWSIGPNWGIQRQLSTRFNFNLTLGAAAEYLSDDKIWHLSPAADIRIGYIIR